MGRAAICFSGQLRNVEKGFEYINKNLIEPNNWDYEFDVFVHSWFENNNIGKSYVTSKGIATGNMEIGGATIPDNILNIVYNLYDPKKMLIEKPKLFDERDYNNRKSDFIVVRNSLSKCYSMLKVGELKTQYEKENNFKYDCVISLRFDYGIKENIILNELDLNAVNISTKGVWNNIGVEVSHGFMNSEIYDQYYQFYNHIDECYRQHNTVFCDEHLLHKYFEIKNIPFIRTNKLDPYDYIRS